LLVPRLETFEAKSSLVLRELGGVLESRLVEGERGPVFGGASTSHLELYPTHSRKAQ
jgi:hypothetical protein